MTKKHVTFGIKTIITIIFALSVNLMPLTAQGATTESASETSSNSSAVSAVTKKPSLKERLKAKREARRLALKKKLAERKAKKTNLTTTPTSPVPSQPSPTPTISTDFDEYQLASLTQDDYEVLPTPTKKSPPAKTQIEKAFFAGVELDEVVPTGFFQNEIYMLSGKLTAGSSITTMFAFLNYQDASGKDEFINFETESKNNTFAIPMRLMTEGSYAMGVVPGTNGKSKIQDVAVNPLPSKNEDVTTTNAANPQITYNPATDSSSINWTRGEDGIYRITFEQGTEQVTYITRQNISSLPIRYSDFKNFKPGNIRIKVSVLPRTMEGGWKTIGSNIAPITYHGFRDIDTTTIEVSGVVPSILTSPTPIAIQGTAKVNLENEAYITNANGLTEKITLQTNNPLIIKTGSTGSIIGKGSTFTLNFTPKSQGRIIVEINDEDGSAALNVPIYIGTGTPLIPDYQDINDTMKVKSKSVDLANDREQMLKFINDIRTGLGKQKVTLNTALNTLAQKHADDMVARNFFGHVNPDGASPEDRRKKDMIPTEVGENLAYSQSLLSSMQGLLRSPIHRANILMDNWRTVGIGITKETSTGNIKVAQEFAPDALTTEGLLKLQSEMLSGLNKARNDAQISSLAQDTTLQNLAKKWSDHLAKTDEFGITTKDGQSLSQEVDEANIASAVQIFVFSSNSSTKLIDRILEPSSGMESKWTKIGLGVSVTTLGEIKITMLLAK